MSQTPDTPSDKSLFEAHRALYQQGILNRVEVVGAQHVQRSLDAATPFSHPMQEFATEACWAWIWSRSGLEKKQRSIINIAMLAALDKGPELGVHVRGAVRNGVTEVELRETLLQVACYAGMPTGLAAFRVAERVLTEMGNNGELPDGYREEK